MLTGALVYSDLYRCSVSTSHVRVVSNNVLRSDRGRQRIDKTKSPGGSVVKRTAASLLRGAVKLAAIDYLVIASTSFWFPTSHSCRFFDPHHHGGRVKSGIQICCKFLRFRWQSNIRGHFQGGVHRVVFDSGLRG